MPLDIIEEDGPESLPQEAVERVETETEKSFRTTLRYVFTRVPVNRVMEIVREEGNRG